jgi:type IV pilus assembly protein PilB
MIGRPVKPFFASASAINIIIDTRYGAQVGEEVEEALEEVAGIVDIKTGETEDITQSDISSAPVSRIVNMILEYAAKFKASDVHIEPRENKLSVRYRVHGVMSEKLTLPKKLIPSIVSRIKILSDLKIDEHRVPQDGRIQLKVDDKLIDLRVSVVPAIYGEKVVMRLLERGGSVLPLEKTGLRGQGYKIFIESLAKTQGIILITGPTGSGKTQTLASSLQILNKPDVNIMTLEDPVEIRVDGVNQVQVNADVGLTFAKGLRSFLRQDPDIIMVGEIRDKETAELAIQASLTGHLVLATLHTNSAAGALPRLYDMGVPPYLLASTIDVVVAQRLVRTLDAKSAEMFVPPDEIVQQIKGALASVKGYDMLTAAGDPQKIELFKAVSSPQNPSGYAGRIGIFEVMRISDKIGRMITGNKSAQEIERQAIDEGMITLLQDGFMKALEGITTVEEILRVRN